jgi:hypothetical protein
MTMTIRQRIVDRFAFYFGAIVLATVVWRIQIHLQSIPIIGSGAPMKDRAVDAFLEMNRLLTTLSTSLLGAMGLLLFGGFNGRSCSRELWAAIVAAVSLGLSIYYGYAVYQAVLSMLATSSFDAYDHHFQIEQYAHFYTFLVGVIFFAGFVYKNMRKEE